MLLRFQQVAPVGGHGASAGGIAVARIASLALALSSGCERSHPWSGQPDGGVIDESSPFLPGRPRADAGSVPPLGSSPLDSSSSGSAPLGQAPLASSEPAAGGSLDLPAPSPVGGLWVSCRDGFRLSGEPLRDVTRLGLMCGPVNGMTALGDPLEGELSAGGGTATHPLAARAGACYRIFAIAGDGIVDLRLAVRSSRGTRLAADELHGRVAVADPERPFCTFEDDQFEIRVAAGASAGRYALQIWQLARR